MPWCFSISFSLANETKLSFPVNRKVLKEEDGKRVAIASKDSTSPISETGSLILKGEGYAEEIDALASAHKWKGWVSLALAHDAIGADFRDRDNPRRGGFTDSFLRKIGEKIGIEIVNENEESIHVYEYNENEPPKMSIEMKANGFATKNADYFMQNLEKFVTSGRAVPDSTLLAYTLYSTALSTENNDARFIVMTAAIESFIKPQPLSQETQKLVDILSQQAKAYKIPKSERDSVLGRIKSIKEESISQAGIRVIQEFDNGRGLTYNGLEVERFFKKCYEIRSNLVHAAHPQVEASRVSEFLPGLQKLVRDLICDPHHN